MLKLTRLLCTASTVLLLVGCADFTAGSSGAQSRPAGLNASELQSRAQSATTFTQIMQLVEPVAERTCRARTVNANCDFKFVVERSPNAPSNAYQSVDANGRPILTFTVALINETLNADELAFVMGHEAAHHIAGHIDRAQQSALVGSLLSGVLAAASGADPAAIERAQNVGAVVGARRFSKAFELEADQLGAVISLRSGFDPIRGAAFFTRIPDPGDKFLGSHPPNADRIETVRRTVANL